MTKPDEILLATLPLAASGPWPTLDPFLFAVHHDDRYPAGNDRLGPDTPLTGRDLGQDFGGKDGWSMYHGQTVPGFPAHPHRGFETVTIVRQGLVDHSDSLGAAARYGAGDVQWLTAGKGIQHAEMFPLLERKAPNPTELFQIWLNLPRARKLAEPYFSMLWADSIPRVALDGGGKKVEVTVVAGRLAGHPAPPPPPPASRATDADADVAIWTIKLAPGARWALPPAGAADVGRVLYFFRGDTLRVAGAELAGKHAAQLRGDATAELVAGATECEALLLQGRPIGEPVVQQGPFVMNTPAEIQQAIADYRATGFGGWPWRGPDPVHDREGRFARRADGKVERPG